MQLVVGVYLGNDKDDSIPSEARVDSPALLCAEDEHPILPLSNIKEHTMLSANCMPILVGSKVVDDCLSLIRIMYEDDRVLVIVLGQVSS